MQIIIDGYNMVKTLPSFSRHNLDIETMRKELDELLRTYKKIKGHQITVVYDSATGGLFGKQQSFKSAGIKEIFTAKGESADNVIKRIAIQNPQNLIVVTADNDVAIVCEKAGATVISPREFEEKIFVAQYVNSKGLDELKENKEDIDNSRHIKKGAPRKFSKKERKDLRLRRKL